LLLLTSKEQKAIQVPRTTTTSEAINRHTLNLKTHPLNNSDSGRLMMMVMVMMMMMMMNIFLNEQ